MKPISRVLIEFARPLLKVVGQNPDRVDAGSAEQLAAGNS